MKVVILAGGLGTRLMEETETRPKPMVEIGRQPIIRHIMQIYARQGFNDFIVAAGYKSEMIERYFATDWRVQVVDTGHDTQPEDASRGSRHFWSVNRASWSRTGTV